MLVSRTRRTAALAALMLAFVLLAQAQPPALPRGMQQVTSVEGITEYRLQNGLRVLLFPDPSKNTITVNITYLVGSRHENYGETGMAHLLEHLVFKGTPRHENIPKELSDHGARPNGTTWYDRTNYFETFQANDANLEWALDLEADRMIHSFIAKKDLDSEMTVVRNEFEMGENNPQSVLEERVMSTSYLWHNYGKSTIGARADIENVPIDRLQAFYRNYYQPDNAILLVAGKVEVAKTLALIDKHFGAIPRPERKLIPTYTAEPTQDGERFVTLRRTGDVQVVCAAYHVPPGSHADFAAVDIFTQLLTDSPSGRLYKALVETKKAARVRGWSYQLKEPGAALFFAEVRKESPVDDARDTLIKTIDGLVTSPATKEEVERARAQILKQIELTLNNSEQIGLQLSEWIGMGDWRLLFLHRDRLRKVTLEDVQRVAAAYLKPSNRTLGVFYPTEKPDRAEIPAAPDVTALVKDYKGDALISQGEAFDPSPANVDARTVRGQLAGGMKLAFVSKKTRGNSVNAVLTLHLGDVNSLANRNSAPTLTSQMLMRGTTRLTRQQIQDELDKLKARVNIAGDPTAVNVTIQTTRENFDATLKLVAEILKEPSFPATEFEQLKQQQLAQIESQRSEPMAVAPLNASRHISPYPKGDVRYLPTFDEQVEWIKTATLDDLKKFHSDFYGASTSELAVAGDFDAEQIQKQASTLFGSWKSKLAFTRVPRPYQKLAAVNRPFELPDKANAMLFAVLPVNIGDEDADYPALIFGNYMLGGGFLNSRLAVRIRQKEGLSYGVASMLQGRPKDNNHIFMTYAISAPENVPKVEAAFKDEIAKVLKDGFTADEIKAAKEGWLQGQQVSRAQDNELARKLATMRFYDRTLAFDADLEKKVTALTPEQITAAMRRHIDVAQISIFKAGDFKKANVSF